MLVLYFNCVQYVTLTTALIISATLLARDLDSSWALQSAQFGKLPVLNCLRAGARGTLLAQSWSQRETFGSELEPEENFWLRAGVREKLLVQSWSQRETFGLELEPEGNFWLRAGPREKLLVQSWSQSETFVLELDPERKFWLRTGSREKHLAPRQSRRETFGLDLGPQGNFWLRAGVRGKLLLRIMCILLSYKITIRMWLFNSLYESICGCNRVNQFSHEIQ